jgi:hypothetical protein
LCYIRVCKIKIKNTTCVREDYCSYSNTFPAPSYDLDMDTRLAEETTTLVECYMLKHTHSLVPALL